MDSTTQWARGIEGIHSTTTSVTSNNNVTPTTTKPQSTTQEQQQLMIERSRAAKPVKEQALKCPRCNSTNTKFCYYNNYSLTQPRYLCKNCRRYWTHGGSLRNVPVGGGTRKNKKPTSSTKISSDIKIINNMQPPPPPPPFLSLPMSSSSIRKPYHGHDLNLAFSDRLSGGFGPLIHMFPLDGNVNGMKENELFPFVVKPSNESGQQIKGQVGDPQVFWSGANLGGNGGFWY